MNVLIIQLNDFIEKIFTLSPVNSLTTQIFLVIFTTLICSFIVKSALDRLHKKAEKTANLWDDSIIIALRRPLRVMIWVVGVSFAIEIIYTTSKTPIFSAIDPIRDVIIISIITWFINSLIKQVQINFIDIRKNQGKKVDETTVDAIAKILRATVIITSGLVIIQSLGFSISGVLAFGGVGGLALGFAAKDLLANFFGAIMIYFDRPFAVGEWIRSPDREIEGTVEEIGWRQTRIRTFNKRPLYIPNSVFSTIVVENPSRMKNRRIYETIGVRYEDSKKLDKIIKEVKDYLTKHKEIDTKQTMIVNVNSFAASSIDFFIYTFTKTTDWVKFHEIKHEILLMINKIIEKNGAEIAFPTSTLHIADDLINVNNRTSKAKTNKK